MQLPEPVLVELQRHLPAGTVLLFAEVRANPIASNDIQTTLGSVPRSAIVAAGR